MSKIYPILEQLFQCKGGNPNLWGSIKYLIQNQSEEIAPFCLFIRNKINNGNKEEILLALIILDFAVEYGRFLLWKQIDNKEFLSCIINIIKNISDLDIQNSALYLIQKLAFKFQNFPAIQNCKDMYNTLKCNNVIFPNKIKHNYLYYISQNNQNNNINNYNNMNNNMNFNNNFNNNMNFINNFNNNMNFNQNFNNINNNNRNNNFNNMNNNINNNMNNNYNYNNNLNNINNNKNKNELKNNNILRQSRVPSNPNDYVKNLNLDLNTSSYEKKYQRLVSKLYDWIYAIQEINILIDNNTNNQHNQKLKTLYEDLKLGNEQLVSNIQGPKLKNEKLMQISLNVCEDMVMTLNRCEKSMRGENPGPFLSSFTRDDNPNDKKNKSNYIEGIIHDDFKNVDPLEKIGKMGFGDTIMTKILDNEEDAKVGGGNNMNNSLSDLFGNVNKTIKLDANQNNSQFFTNMSNSNINISDVNIKYKDYNYNNPNVKIAGNKIIGNNVNHNSLLPNNKKIADNNDIKRLIYNNAYEKDLIHKQLFQTQKFPTSHLNLNDFE